MIITRKSARFAALVAGGALALSACTSSEEPADDAGGDTGGGDTQPITLTYGYEQEYASYNNNTSAQNAVANTIVLNQVLRGFWYFGADGSVTPDEEFGTTEVTSEDPLTVEYTFAEEAVWSDGEPIDCDDAKLAYIANLGLPSGETAEDGSELLLFDSAGTTGYEDFESLECADGDKTFVVTYTTPFADFDALFGGTEILPAHIVEAETGIDDIIPLVDEQDVAGLAPASEFYINGWVFNPGELNPEISPSAGPYQVDSWEAGNSLTLVANPEWWGTPPLAETIVIRYIAQDQQAQALENGEINAMDPQPNPELLAQLEGLGDAVNFSTGDQFSFEHLDFNFATYFSDRNLREAFALCVPRQLIVDNLIVPQNPEAQVQQARLSLPFQPEYPEISSAYPGGYDEPDIATATELVNASGQPTPIPVRIGYRTPNPRRTSTVDLIRDSCSAAGFDVQDIGTEDFFGNGLTNGIFDVALFAWAGSPIVTSSSSTYVTNGGNNNGTYTNPQVDELTTQLNGELDADAQVQLQTEIEGLLWEDLATIPLYAFPGIFASDPNAEGIVFQPSQTGLTWNIQEWTLAAQ